VTFHECTHSGRWQIPGPGARFNGPLCCSWLAFLEFLALNLLIFFLVFVRTTFWNRLLFCRWMNCDLLLTGLPSFTPHYSPSVFYPSIGLASRKTPWCRPICVISSLSRFSRDLFSHFFFPFFWFRKTF